MQDLFNDAEFHCDLASSLQYLGQLDQAIASLQVLPKTSFRETLEGLPRAVSEHVGTLG